MNPVIIIPVYNGRDSLYSLVKAIKKTTERDIVVVNDGSTDGLEEKKLNISCLLQHRENMGKGAALKTGLNYAKGQGFTHAVTIDADFQHDPSLLPAFFDLIYKYPRSLVVGARKLTDPKMPFHRMLSNNITSLMLSLRIGSRIYDSQVGYRAYPLIDSELWHSLENGFQFESDVFFRAAKLKYGLAWQPIPVIYSDEPSNMHLLKDTLRYIRTYFRSFLC